jgi:serine protease AprX
VRRLALPIALLVLTGIAVVPSAAASRSTRAAVVDPEVANAAGRVSALVHVGPGTAWRDGVSAARSAGAAIGTRYRVIRVFVAYGTATTFLDLARSGAVSFIEHNEPLELFTETSHVATRGQRVLDGEITLDGTTIDGTGVGVAVVDSGVDGTHPDLVSNMGGNVRIYCTTPQPAANNAVPFTECRGPKQAVDLDDTDTPAAGGHGTHVAGIVAGDGSASGGRFHGAAPGATLYGVGVGTTLVVENGLDGLAWVLANHDLVTPKIKVVNNSWGSGYSVYKGAAVHNAMWLLQEALVAAGVTVVFAAGNGGGTGNPPTTSAQCVNPTPGVICVANYDDGNSGTRAGGLSSSSSRGGPALPDSWPDISAPGTQIASTCRATLPVCAADGDVVTDPPNSYAGLSGTSMAAPHIAGIVAQLLQVDPTLTPAGIEDILEDTAHKFEFGTAYVADPNNTDDTSSFDKGHGLVDVPAAINEILNPGATEPAPEPLAIAPTFAEQQVYFTCGAGGAGKLQNTESPAGWSTVFPAGSYTAGAGCGVLDPGAAGNYDPYGGPEDPSFSGTAIGNLKNATVDLWLLGHTNYSAFLAPSVRVWLTIDDKTYVARTQADLTWQASDTGASRKIQFTITDLGSFTEVFEGGERVGVIPRGVATEDGDGSTEHTVNLTVGLWFSDETGVWVWGANEIASGITFNDATPAPETVKAVPEE